jgi:RNA polymerase sigma-70 factor (family 1)
MSKENTEIDLPSLLFKVANSDRSSFCILFDTYQPLVYSFALKITKSELLAEEAVQEIFIKIWIKRTSLTQVVNFGAYLNRIVRNYALNVLRDKAMEAKVSKNILSDFNELTFDTQNSIHFKETEALLHQAIQRLSPQQKQVYLLCHHQGLKYEEAAREMNLSPLTVQTHMKLALRSIRSYLVQHVGYCALLFSYMFP